MSLLASNPSIKTDHRWQLVTAALVLAVAQLFSQLHSLEHLEEHDGDRRVELSCTLCVLSADLDNGHASASPTIATDSASDNESVAPPHHPHFSSLSYSFHARSPPVVGQFS